ncbi:methyltransferase family protein [Candidatus Neomarinimicrobiota bacterium]
MNTPNDNQTNELRQATTKRLKQLILITVLSGLLLFASAGDFRWAEGWMYMVLCVVMLTINARVLMSKHPDLAAERSKIQEGAKEWDKPLALYVGRIGPNVLLIVCGLDYRFGWSPDLSLAAKVAGGAVVILGYFVVGWAMYANKFFSGVVRIQDDRDHVAISSGPYRFVRHPGYTGLLLLTVALPVLLGTLWGLVAAGVTAVVLVIRTAKEDSTLFAELDGYTEYTKSTRYRLLPLVW